MAHWIVLSPSVAVTLRRLFASRTGRNVVSYSFMTSCKRMQRMKRMSFVLGLAAVAASTTLPAATVSVSGFKGTVYGPGEATLAFTGVDAEQELWVAWDDADKGVDISQWSKSEQLGTIASVVDYKLSQTIN